MGIFLIRIMLSQKMPNIANIASERPKLTGSKKYAVNIPRANRINDYVKYPIIYIKTK